MLESENLLVHMQSVLAAERDLRDLALVWQMVELSAEVSCADEAEAVLQTLRRTRQRFDELQSVLIRQMVLENSAEVGDDMAARAQCAIDILVRNLYERTADVGFLATDDPVRSFCGASPQDRLAQRPALVRRLGEYQAKYTVYDDVVLLSVHGEVLVRLDGDDSARTLREPWVAQAIAATGYVEHFGATALAAPGTGTALLYAQAIRAANGGVLGVLALRFRFRDEMRRIFDGVVGDPQRLVMVLLDGDDRVVATSDESHIPCTAALPSLPLGRMALTTFAGREYVSRCCASQGYQGYAGPGWRAVAMVSLLTAFRLHGAAGDDASHDVPLDNPELAKVQDEADAINKELRRVLWNGRLLIDGEGAQRSRMKAVLRQVSNTGARTRVRVTRAIHDIYRVALARTRHQAEGMARLAADIMDRNLYERANDCRWWALSPVVRHRLEQPRTEQGDAELHGLLRHINGLYTVYSQLIAFDAQGVVRAVSCEAEVARWSGQTVPTDWMNRLRTVTDSQSYAVTPFESTPFHDQGPTYVYLAAVRSLSHSATVGGVAIVFNAQREFGAMLKDILGEHAGFAAFADDQRNLLACTDGALAGPAVQALSGQHAVLAIDGAHYACARVQAPGYREFKTTDGYDNGVHALIGLRLGATEMRQASFSDVDLSAAGHPADPRPRRELAVFQVAALRYALPVEVIVAAIAPEALVRTPSVQGATLGLVEVVVPTGTRLVQVFCARKLLGVSYPARKADGVLLVLRSPLPGDASLIGWRVDDVLTVIDAAATQIHDAPSGLRRYASWVDALVDCQAQGIGGPNRVLVQVLSHDRLWQDCARNQAAHPGVNADTDPVDSLAAT